MCPLISVRQLPGYRFELDEILSAKEIELQALVDKAGLAREVTP